ncbi:Protein polybromo-1 [Armadillidium nasatum]|uniref:Protein polybromo-1 n=1 Tax=Armadillidium nasatum TaxID=96803 RepID=A0A5N5TEZ5_9CRUS|nr:Protein polybromo-1 [Armadillidium nasatum]
MPKRKRLGDEEDGNSMNSTLSEGRPKRRRNDTTLVDTIQYIFDALRNKKKEDDTYLCEAFLRVPKKKTEPQYYEVVSKPIDMLKIQQKIKTDVYNEIEEFCSDVELLVANAKLYYAKRGRPPKASVASSAPMMLEEDGTPMTSQDAIEELFGAIVTASDSEGRFFSYDFLLLPAPEKYPKYYQVIQQPIDMKTIALHIQDDHYENVDSLERDMSLMFDNACIFNEPGSRIYKDARTLKNLTQIRKQDLVHVLNAKKSVRLRSKRAPDGKKWSELVANLQEGEILPMPVEDGQLDLSVSMAAHEDDESDEDVDQDSLFWQLFMAAKNLTAPNDPHYLLCEPFRRLPNRRWHSDYYQEIKNPISMSQIRKKIVKGDYHMIAEMVDDFNLMLDNAQQYNRPDSRIYKDAVKLQKFIQTKSEELSALEEEYDSDSDTDDTDSQMSGRRKTGQARPWTFKRRAKLLFKTLMDYMTDDGRQPIVAFIEKPSRKDHPNYYELISDPIDMEMIESKIKGDYYSNDDELIADFRLMLKNCRAYNEQTSQVYQDSLILEKVLNDKLGELQYGGDQKTKCIRKSKYIVYVNMTKNIKLLFNAIRDYRDKDGRQLSEVFLRLPPKSQYPDYYEVIKQPIDLERILQKWKSGCYSSLDDIMNDLILMFQNACRYNEPESQIYRDALTLQRLAMQKRLELSSKDECVPNVGGLVQEMLMSLFISVFNHEICEGRYTVESFADLPEYEENCDYPILHIQRLWKNNAGQQMLYGCQYYRPAETFHLPTRKFYEQEVFKTEKHMGYLSQSNCVSHNQIQYFVGDFVYLNPPEKNCDYPILHIQRLWKNNAGQQMLYGCQYYRPAETFHLPTRKFYEQEVFKTEKHMGLPLSEVVGKCVVLSAVDYPKLRVDNFDEKDVYVCESRYSTKNRFFKKIKVWPFSLPEGTVITERPEPFAMRRVGSIFKERIDKHKEELAELEEETKVIRSSLPNVLKSAEPDIKGNLFYQQYNSSSGTLKLGDFVYVRSGGIKSIRHVIRIWVTSEGTAFVSGTRYVRAQDVAIISDRKPYKAEVYLTSTQETLPLSEIMGKCCVLHVKEYITQRHTEIPENDVYLCEKFYDEMNQRLCTLQSGILKFTNLPPEIYPNEIYYFWRPLNPMKPEVENEDSMDGRPPSVASADSSLPPTSTTPIPTSTPKTSKKQPSVWGKLFQQKTGKKQVTGYILFSAEIRKSVTQRNPDSNFGEISRLVGIEWKKLTETERKAFEDKAHQMNLESAEKAQAMLLDSPGTPQVGTVSTQKISSELPLPNNPDMVFECLWDNCDFMFEDLSDLYDHVFSENTGHFNRLQNVFECSWRGCSRHKKTSLTPFPLMQRLIRHVREVHIAKTSAGRVVPHHERSRNFVPSSRQSLINSDSNSSPAPGLNPTGRENQYQITIGTPIQVNGINGLGQKSTDPLFVNPPPKTQRLLHSEAYIKYIENLDKPFVSNWERQLTSSVDNTIINDTGRLPSHWLANGVGNHGSVVNALWALREYMMKDSLGIAKIL